jgi:hypothetical protein
MKSAHAQNDNPAMRMKWRSPPFISGLNTREEQKTKWKDLRIAKLPLSIDNTLKIYL